PVSCRPLPLDGELSGARAPEDVSRHLRDPPATVLLHQPLSVLLPRDGRLPHSGGPDRLPHAEPRLRPLRARVSRPAPDAASALESTGDRLPRVFCSLSPLG